MHRLNTRKFYVKGSILAIEDNFSALFKDEFEHKSIIFITTEINLSFAFYKTEIILTISLYIETKSDF